MIEEFLYVNRKSVGTYPGALRTIKSLRVVSEITGNAGCRHIGDESSSSRGSDCAEFPDSPYLDLNIRELFRTHPDLVNLRVSISQGSNDRRFGADGLLRPAHLTLIEVLVRSRNSLNTSKSEYENWKRILDHVKALADANLGTTVQNSGHFRSIRYSDRKYVALFLDIQDDHVGVENLWKFYKIFPCRSLGGLITAVSPELLAKSYAKRLEVTVEKITDDESQQIRQRASVGISYDITDQRFSLFNFEKVYNCPLAKRISLIKDLDHSGVSHIRFNPTDHDLGEKSVKQILDNDTVKWIKGKNELPMEMDPVAEIQIEQAYEKHYELTDSSLIYRLKSPYNKGKSRRLE